jgi:hypothetical protein
MDARHLRLKHNAKVGGSTHSPSSPPVIFIGFSLLHLLRGCIAIAQFFFLFTTDTLAKGRLMQVQKMGVQSFLFFDVHFYYAHVYIIRVMIAQKVD